MCYVSEVLLCFTPTVVSSPDCLLFPLTSWVSVRKTPGGERLGQTLKRTLTQWLNCLNVKSNFSFKAKAKLPNARPSFLQKKEGFPTNPFNQIQCSLLTKILLTLQKGLLGLFSFKKKKHNLHIECLYFPNHSELGKGGKNTSVSIWNCQN